MPLEDMVTDRMNVQRPPATVTKDNSGAPVQSFSDIATNVPAQITPLSAGQRVTAAMAGMAITHKILTLYSGVKQGDRIYDPDADVYIRIKGIQRIPERGGIPLHYLMDGEEVKDGTE